MITSKCENARLSMSETRTKKNKPEIFDTCYNFNDLCVLNVLQET